MKERTYKSGEVIFNEGQIEFCMYELLKGKVGIYVNYGKPEEKMLTELKAGDGVLFGEMAMIEGMGRSATAVALEDVQVLPVDGKEFADYFSKNPERIYEVMTQMGKRICALNQDYHEACHAAYELAEHAASDEEPSGWFQDQMKKITSVLAKVGK